MSDWQNELEQVLAPAVARSATLAEVSLGRGALNRAGAVARRRFAGRHAVIFADDAGFAAAGAGAERSLAAAGLAVTRRVIPADPLPKPDVALAQSFRDGFAPDTIPVALGSGVVNDLVKYAAFLENRPYFSIATAASMDGYASAGAPLIRDGFKMTVPARAPRAILADLDVIASAPGAMTSWGYGDLAGKVPAGGDWIIADALGVEALDDVAWPLVQDNLRGWLADPGALARGDPGAVARLFAGLTLVGLAMEFHGSSRPASGADHQIAHLWEMQGLEFAGRKVSHGACVSVGCVAMLGLFDWLIDQDLGAIDPAALARAAPDPAQRRAAVDAAFPDPRIAARAHEETSRKHPTRAALEQRLAALRAGWPALRDRLRARLLRGPQMARLLRAAGAPARAADIGVGPGRLAATVRAARFIRSRYTLLDLLDETGLLDQAVAAMIAGQDARTDPPIAAGPP